MGNKMEAAYRLGQLQAMEKLSQDRGGLTYNPTYSQADIDAIRRYNRDVASGSSNYAGARGALGAAAGSAVIPTLRKYQNFRALGNSQVRSADMAMRGIKDLAMSNKGKLALLLGGGFALGKGLGYLDKRLGQGIDNYVLTDLNSQDRR